MSMTVTATGDALAELSGRIGDQMAAISEELTAQVLESIDVLSIDEFAHERLLASAQANVAASDALLQRAVQ
jgi:hypothetical protein